MSSKTALIAAVAGLSLLATACTTSKVDDVDLSYTIPRSAALVATSVYLNKYPESIDVLSHVADKISALADSPVIPIEDVLNKVSCIVNNSQIKNKKACMAVLRSLVDEYSITALTVADYSYILKETALGIADAIDLYVFQNPTNV